MSAVEDYLKTLDEPQRVGLERIRRIVREVAPQADEVISYGIPGFKYRQKYLVGFAAFKDHLSLFPTSHPLEVMRSDLGKYKLSKGTIQFTIEHPIPESVVKQLIEIRLADIRSSE